MFNAAALRLSFAFLVVLLTSQLWAASLPLTVPPPGQSSALDVSRTSPEHTAISLTASALTVDEVVVDFHTYHVIRLPGEPVLFDEGAPALPRVTRYYRIPNTGSVELFFNNATFESLENIDPLPAQIEGKEFHGLLKDRAVYGKNEWYPPEIATISAPMIMRDFRVVMVSLYPVQVNPVIGQARVYQNLDVEIVANNQPGENELFHPRTPSRNWKPIYSALIPNLEPYALDQVTENPGTYLILCRNHPQALPFADSLRQWKLRQGYDVVLQTRAAWTTNQMRTAIQTLYAESEPPLEFVCIIGDANGSFSMPTSENNYDHIFSLGNDGDDLADIGVGRLSAQSVSQLYTINTKIMAYEREPWTETETGEADTMWYHRALFTASSSFEQVNNYLVQQWAAQQFQSFTTIDCTYVMVTPESFEYDSLAPFFGAAANEGIGFFSLQGYIGELYSDFPGQLLPSRKLPIVVVLGDGTGDFVPQECLSEAFLVAGTPFSPKGGVCAIGYATFLSYLPAMQTFGAGFDYALANLGIESVAHAMIYGKLLVQTYDTLATGEIQPAHNINLMGEPSLSMWTDTPVTIDVDFPSAVNVGTREVVAWVTDATTLVPIPAALVVLWKEGETFARELTGIDGRAILPVCISSPGDLLLTVTKRNHKPYLSTIPCGFVDEWVSMSSYYVDDDNDGGTQGNGDSLFNPGEIVDLNLYLRNSGVTETATENSVALESTDPFVTVFDGFSTVPDLPPGDSALTANPLRVLISPAMPHGIIAVLSLIITTEGVDRHEQFEIECHAGALAFSSYELESEIGPGLMSDLQITLQNRGEQPLTDVTAELVSRSPFVIVTDNSAAFGSLSPGELRANLDPFALAAVPESYRGYPASMQLFTGTPNGPLDTLDFTLYIGTADSTDPTGPDAYGYFAFDDSDTSYEFCPSFDYVDISSGLGTNLELEDIGEKTSIDQLWSTARVLPFSFTFYGTTYDTITICSNGWVAFGDQSWNDCFRNYPIPGISAPDAMIAPYWDDLKTSPGELGVWEYFDAANHRYVVQWKAEGAFVDTTLNFELILFDETEYPTEDGNGMILIQYQDVTMGLSGEYQTPGGCTVGIQAPGCLSGLQVAHTFGYAPGAAEIHDGRALLFRTALMETAAPEPPVTIPSQFTLHQNFPNPFNPRTEIAFDLPLASFVTLEVYNTLGQRVATLANEHRPAGQYKVSWDGSSFSTGLYLYQLRAGAFVETRKMILLK